MYYLLTFLASIAFFLIMPVNQLTFDNWFEGRNVIFDFTGNCKYWYTPIFAVALFYKINQIFLGLFGLLTLENEYYMGVFSHCICLWISGVFIYKLLLIRGQHTAGIFVGLFYQMFIYSTFLPISFFAENIFLFLWILFFYYLHKVIFLKILSKKDLVFLGIFYSLLAITRYNHIFIIFNLCFIIWFFIRRIKPVATFVTIFGIFLLLFLSMNYLRFGNISFITKPEQHLWNAAGRNRVDYFINKSNKLKILHEYFEEEELKQPFWVIEEKYKKLETEQKKLGPDIKYFINIEFKKAILENVPMFLFSGLRTFCRGFFYDFRQTGKMYNVNPKKNKNPYLKPFINIFKFDGTLDYFFKRFLLICSRLYLPMFYFLLLSNLYFLFKLKNNNDFEKKSVKFDLIFLLSALFLTYTFSQFNGQIPRYHFYLFTTILILTPNTITLYKKIILSINLKR